MQQDLATLSAAFVTSSRYRDFTLRQLAIICVLGDEPGPHTVRALAKRLQFSKPVVTRACNTLIGLVERHKDASDGRSVLLSLTGAGRVVRDDLRRLSNG